MKDNNGGNDGGNDGGKIPNEVCNIIMHNNSLLSIDYISGFWIPYPGV